MGINSSSIPAGMADREMLCHIYTQQLTNLHFSTLKMAAAHTSETSATLPTTTWCSNQRIELTSIKNHHHNRRTQQYLLDACFQAGFLLSLFFKHENRSDMFL
jgi:hypothetical protein